MPKINSTNNASGYFSIDPGSSGDSFVQLSINTTGKFRIGVDDSDSDKLKISAGSALGTNDCLIIDSSGNVVKKYQPAFAAESVAILNQTGDGTAYTVSYSNAEFFDQNSDFNGTTTFTAPVTGKYQFNISVRPYGFTSSYTSTTLSLVTSNRTYITRYFNPGAIAGSATVASTAASLFVDMDASDTATVSYVASGSTKSIDIGTLAYFSAYLVC